MTEVIAEANQVRTVFGQPSWRIAADGVEAFVTRQGGHIAPVYYHLGDRTIQPFSISPWAEEPVAASTPKIERSLRGDFFCLPFGANDAPFNGEQHPVHGETANNDWTFVGCTRESGWTKLALSMDTTIRHGRVDKLIAVQDGRCAVYSRHAVSGMSGPMEFGHHATLKFPADAGCAGISVSPFVHGQVLPVPFEIPADGGYQFLKPGARFTTLSDVAALNGESADLSRYPARKGYEDLVIVVSEPGEFAWTAAAVPSSGYCWFALKDPRVLRNTVLWHSNGGRHYAPWNGRHTSVLGLEEVTANYHLGIASSVADNELSRLGYPTSVNLDPKTPLVVNTINGVVAIGKDFDRVKTITRTGAGIELVSESGVRVSAALEVDFLYGS